MKKYYLFGTLIMLYTSCIGQCSCSELKDTSIFYRSQAKDVETISFKAIYKSFGMMGHLAIMDKLLLKGYIKKDKYKTAISIQPINMLQNFYMPYMVENSSVYNKLRDNIDKEKQVCITAKIIKNYKSCFGKPFFLITAICFE